ncbi:acyl-CoA thioesterase [Propionibacteriaceae bacterium Y1923]
MNDTRWLEQSGLDIRSRGDIFTVDLPVRWGDMDAQGHVNNGVYFDYLQDARIDFLVEGGATDMMSGVVAVSHTIEYKAPITYSEQPAHVQMIVLQRGAARFRVGYLIMHDGVLCALAASTLTPFDMDAQRPRRLTPDEVDLLDRHRWRVERPFPPLPKPALEGRGYHSTSLTRWSDVDKFNHVNNVRMLDFFQEGRIEMTTAADPLAARIGTAGSEEGRSLWLVARQDVDYIHQMAFRRHPYDMYTAVTRIGRSSLTLAAEIVDPADGRVISRAQHVMVRADAEGRPCPIEDGMRAGLAHYLVD